MRRSVPVPTEDELLLEELLLLEEVDLLESGQLPQPSNHNNRSINNSLTSSGNGVYSDEYEEEEEEDEVVLVDDDEFLALRIKVPCSVRSSSSSRSSSTTAGAGAADVIRIQVRPEDSVGKLKEIVLTALGEPVTRYLRLVCKGRLLAPDPAPLKALTFVQANDVVHAVLASSPQKPGMPSNNTASSTNNNTTTSGTVGLSVQAALQQGVSTGLTRRALRGAGINASGLAVRRTPADDEDDDSEEEQQAEYQTTTTNSRMDSHQQQRPLHRQYRGFDRLRALGLRRAEITALRSYFSRQVDRFVLEQQQQQPQQQQQSQQQQPSSLSLEQPNSAAASSAVTTTAAVVSSEIVDPVLRRQMQEEAWMQSQGPLSEFRLNLPSGGGLALISLLRNNSISNTTNANHNNGIMMSNGINGIRIANTDDNPDTLFWQSTTHNTTSRGNNNNSNGNPVVMTTNNFGNDRDFVCGFALGFFVGFIMLVWVWMPTVPHRQKLGILTGITLQLALGMLRPTTNHSSSSSLLHQQQQHSDWLDRHGIVRHSGYAQLLRGGNSGAAAAATNNSAMAVVANQNNKINAYQNTDDAIVLG